MNFKYFCTFWFAFTVSLLALNSALKARNYKKHCRIWKKTSLKEIKTSVHAVTFLGFGAIMLLLSIVELAECWRQILRGNSDIVLVLSSYQPSYYWLLILHMHSFLFWTEFYPSFLIGMVFFFQNCSDLLWEKNSSSDREKLWDH